MIFTNIKFLLKFNIIDRICSIIKIIFLASFINPEQYALFGSMLLLLAFLDSLTRIGLEENLYRKACNAQKHGEILFSYNVIRSILIFGIGVYVIFLVPSFLVLSIPNNFTELHFFAVLMLSSYAFSMLKNKKIFLDRRELSYSRDYNYKNYDSLFSTFFLAIFLYLGLGEIALLLSYACGKICATTLSYRSFAEIYLPKYDIMLFKNIYYDRQFIFSIYLSILITFFVQYFDRIILSQMADAALFGYYTFAFNTINTSVGAVLKSFSDYIKNYFFKVKAENFHDETLRLVVSANTILTHLIFIAIIILQVLSLKYDIKYVGDWELKLFLSCAAFSLMFVRYTTLSSYIMQISLAKGEVQNITKFQFLMLFVLAPFYLYASDLDLYILLYVILAQKLLGLLYISLKQQKLYIVTKIVLSDLFVFIYLSVDTRILKLQIALVCILSLFLLFNTCEIYRIIKRSGLYAKDATH